jgi:hypothetical protein
MTLGSGKLTWQTPTPKRDPVGVRTLLGCTRSASKPRVPSLIIGSSDDNNMGLGERLGQNGIRVDWFLINCVFWAPYIYKLVQKGVKKPLQNMSQRV